MLKIEIATCVALIVGWTGIAFAAEPEQVSSKFGDWTKRCTTVEGQVDRLCELNQRVSMRDTGQLMSELTIVRVRDSQDYVLLVRVPTGAWLPKPVSLLVDDKAVIEAGYINCNAGGCFAEKSLDMEKFEEVLNAQKLEVSFVSGASRTVIVPHSLEGLTDAALGFSDE